MGHVKPGRKAAGQESEGLSPADPYSHPVWALWDAIRHDFSVARAPWEALTSSTSWGYMGNDFVSGLRRDRPTMRTFTRLDAAPEHYGAVRALAELNVRRHEQMFHALVLFYVTVPLTIVLAMGEVIPEAVAQHLRDNMPYVIAGAAPLVFGVISYMIGLWRARQMVAVMTLWRLERDDRAA